MIVGSKNIEALKKLSLVLVMGVLYAWIVSTFGFWPSTILLAVGALMFGLMLLLGHLAGGGEHDIVVKSWCVTCRHMHRRRIPASLPKLVPSAFAVPKRAKAVLREPPAPKAEPLPATTPPVILVEDAREPQALESRTG